MKPLSLILQVLSLMTLLVSAPAVQAQTVSGPVLSGVDAALLRLFGEHKAFSAELVLSVYDTHEREILRTTAGLAVRDEKLRMEVDMSRLKSKDLPAGVAGSLEQIGMGKVVSLVLPEKRSFYLIYPGLESMLAVPMDEHQLKAAASEYQLERVAIGTETLDGHACKKYRVTVTDSSGAKQQAITWNATDLKDFPVQIQMSDDDQLMILRLRNPKLVAPKPELFALPAGFTQYNSQAALMRAVMMKALSGSGDSGGQ